MPAPIPTPAPPVVHQKSPYDVLYEHAVYLGLPEWQAARIYHIADPQYYDFSPEVYQEPAGYMASPTPAGYGFY